MLEFYLTVVLIFFIGILWKVFSLIDERNKLKRKIDELEWNKTISIESLGVDEKAMLEGLCTDLRQIEQKYTNYKSQIRETTEALINEIWTKYNTRNNIIIDNRSYTKVPYKYVFELIEKYIEWPLRMGHYNLALGKLSDKGKLMLAVYVVTLDICEKEGLINSEEKNDKISSLKEKIHVTPKQRDIVE